MTQISGNINPDVSPVSGSNDGTVQIQVGANPGSTQRTQTIRVKNASNTKYVDVILVQEAPVSKPDVYIRASAQYIAPRGLKIDLSFWDDESAGNPVTLADDLNINVNSADPSTTPFNSSVLAGDTTRVIRNQNYYTYEPQEDIILSFVNGTGTGNVDWEGSNAIYHIVDSVLPITN